MAQKNFHHGMVPALAAGMPNYSDPNVFLQKKFV